MREAQANCITPKGTVVTWHTQVGDRYLKGAEARLFRAAMCRTLEEIEDGTHDFRNTLLHHHKKKSLFHLFIFVGTHLLRPTDEAAPLNAWTEGAVGVIFRQLENELIYELDTQDESDEFSHYWRKRIDAAIDETCPEAREYKGPDDHELSEKKRYSLFLELLEEQILWDLDWEVEDDNAPDEVNEMLGIDREYFEWHLSGELTKAEALEKLGDLCGFLRGEYEGQDVD